MQKLKCDFIISPQNFKGSKLFIAFCSVMPFCFFQPCTMRDYITIQLDKDYSRNVARSFSHFERERKFWDCKINVGTETLCCHSVIISSLSSVIEEMIETKIRDGSKKEITFEDIQPDIMRKIINYMYTGSVNIPKELALEVVQVCDELKIEDLKERCLFRVPEILSPQTAMSWMRYAQKNELESIFDSCKRYVSDSFLEVTKEKQFIRLSLDDLKTTLLKMNGSVSPDNLLVSVLSWINYDKEYRKMALDYTLQYLELKNCKKQFLSESAKEHIDIFRCNPKFNRIVKDMLHPRKLTLTVIGGVYSNGGESYDNTRGWKLLSETKFVDITEIPDDLLKRAPSICLYDWNKLILTGGKNTNVCIMFETLIKKWKKMKNLKNCVNRHASVCICQEVTDFGGDSSCGDDPVWSKSVDFLNIEQDHGEWQSAPPMPLALKYPRVTNIGTSVYLMGETLRRPGVLYLFDATRKVWSQKTAMPVSPGRCFSIASGSGSLYVAGGHECNLAVYNFSTDSWTLLSSTKLNHYGGALLSHQNSLLLLGGGTENIEGICH